MVRRGVVGDAGGVAVLAGELAQSFPFSRAAFDVSFPAVLNDPDACLLVAVDEGEHRGYLLGFRHPTFFANGPVAVVEEILVREGHRTSGVGRALMTAFERWAHKGGCRLITLATRRAAPFYRALGYEESAAHFHKQVP